jgi:hypothetical protein
MSLPRQNHAVESTFHQLNMKKAGLDISIDVSTKEHHPSLMTALCNIHFANSGTGYKLDCPVSCLKKRKEWRQL